MTVTALENPALVDRPLGTATKPRRRRKPATAADEKGQGSAQVLFFLGERSAAGLVLGEKFDTEGLAMIEALKRDIPFYRVEVWKSRALVKDGAVEITKEPDKFPP